MDKGDKMRTKILEVIKRYSSENGYSPSLRQIAAMVGFTSSSPVAYHLCILASEGKITYTPNIHRSLKVVE